MNEPNFPQPELSSNAQLRSGHDPIIGQAGGKPRQIFGVDPKDQSKQLDLPVDWVIPKGGEYFFTPSITALKTKFAKAS